MGFGFNLFFIFILIPITGILLISWMLSQKVWIGKMLGLVWLGIFGLMLLVGIGQWFIAKTILDKSDYYGEYVVKRDYFQGAQSDWQYNHMRFEITEEDSIYFYLTEGEEIMKTYRGIIDTRSPHGSARLVIKMDKPSHHVMSYNPTTYRSSWDFYLVFQSPKFYNVFFEKGRWRPID